MPRCAGKTRNGKRCAHITDNEDGYCFQHTRQTEPICCPICTETLCITGDILCCGHFVHKTCVKKWADAMQDEIVGAGYPALVYGKCPLCRADQPDIRVRHATWAGSILLAIGPIRDLLRILTHNNGWVSIENIPVQIIEQMPDATIEEQHLVANCVASQLWIASREKVPKLIRLIRPVDSHFRVRFGF